MKENNVANIEIKLLDLDAMVKLIKGAFSLELWYNLVELSDALLFKVNQRLRGMTVTDSEELITPPQRPLVYYYGYSLLMKGSALKNLGKYHEAKHCIENYSDLSWFEDLNDEGLEVVDYFRYVSYPNRLEIELTLGNFNVMSEFITFLRENPDEILYGVIAILKAANKHHINVDQELSIFADQINELTHRRIDVNEVFDTLVCAYYAEQTQYCLNKQSYQEAIHYCFLLASLSLKYEKIKAFRKAVIWIEQLRSFTTSSQIDTYISILKGEWQNEEVSINGDPVHVSH